MMYFSTYEVGYHLSIHLLLLLSQILDLIINCQTDHSTYTLQIATLIYMFIFPDSVVFLSKKKKTGQLQFPFIFFLSFYCM